MCEVKLRELFGSVLQLASRIPNLASKKNRGSLHRRFELIGKSGLTRSFKLSAAHRLTEAAF